MEEFFEISVIYYTVCNRIIYIMHTVILKLDLVLRLNQVTLKFHSLPGFSITYR